MKVAIHLTEKITFKWPIDYWVELIRKLTKAGHEVYALSDEYNIKIEDKNPLLFDRLNMDDELSEKVIAQADVFVGVPGKYFQMARKVGTRAIALLGSSHDGEGVRSSMPCSPCRGNIENVNDCIWEDELCMWEITANDVLEAICG